MMSCRARIVLLLCFCGGLIVPQRSNAWVESVSATGMRVLFAVNEDAGTVTAIYRIAYEGGADTFTWLIPVPAEPLSVEFADPTPLMYMEYFRTDVWLDPPPVFCDLTPMLGMGEEFPSPPTMETADLIEYQVVGGTPPEGLEDDLTPAQVEALARYREQGMYVIALQLQQNVAREVNERNLPLVIVMYRADDVSLPLQLALSDRGPLYVVVWILADTPYVPANYPRAEVDYSKFFRPDPQAHQIMNLGLFLFEPRPGSYPHYAYPAVRADTLRQANNRAFITELAAPVNNVPLEFAPEDGPFYSLVAESTYITRLSADLEAGMDDPIFEPDPGAPDVSNQVNLSDWVDPLAYWGCSSETALAAETLAHLPTDHTRIDEWGFAVAHPEGWILSEILLTDEQPLYVIAPEPVDLSTIHAFFCRGSRPPYGSSDGGYRASGIDWARIGWLGRLVHYTKLHE